MLELRGRLGHDTKRPRHLHNSTLSPLANITDIDDDNGGGVVAPIHRCISAAPGIGPVAPAFESQQKPQTQLQELGRVLIAPQPHGAQHGG